MIGRQMIPIVLILLLPLAFLALGQDGSIKITTSKSGYNDLIGAYPVVGKTGSATATGSYPSGPANTISGGLGLQVIDHSMASQVDEQTGELVAGSSKFSATSSRAYSWLQLGKIDSAHQVEWRWISPDGRLYYSYVDWIPEPDKGALDVYYTYSYISIAGDDAARMPGNWHVDIFLDGDEQKSLTEQFTILGQAGEQSFGSAAGSIKTECRTDPISGKVICQDTRGDSSNPMQDNQGGCYKDPATGMIICVDSTGDFSNSEENVQGGCYRDPATGQMICVDTASDLFSGGRIGEQI